jgi:hypothetical protein
LSGGTYNQTCHDRPHVIICPPQADDDEELPLIPAHPNLLNLGKTQFNCMATPKFMWHSLHGSELELYFSFIDWIDCALRYCSSIINGAGYSFGPRISLVAFNWGLLDCLCHSVTWRLGPTSLRLSPTAIACLPRLKTRARRDDAIGVQYMLLVYPCLIGKAARSALQAS